MRHHPQTRTRDLILLAAGLLALTPADAWAYVDPGTGSYFFQLAAAGFLAGMFTLRRYLDAMKAALRAQLSGRGESRRADSADALDQ